MSLRLLPRTALSIVLLSRDLFRNGLPGCLCCICSILTWASRFEDASYEAKHMLIAELVDRIEVKKDYEITIYWRMTADQFLGKKTEASA